MRRLIGMLCGLLLLAGTANAGTLYMIDSGVSRPGVTIGPDFVDGSWVDCHGHGTVMSYITGVPATSIVSVRVLGCNNLGTNAAIVAGLTWVASTAVQGDVVLMALNNYTIPQPDYTWDSIIEWSIDQGVTWVVSAGNADNWTHWNPPSRIEKAIVVAAADGLYRWSYSSYGPQVDLYADACAYGWCGTSVSAALVAGDVFALLDLYPWAPTAHITNILRDNCLATMIDPGPGTTACKR